MKKKKKSCFTNKLIGILCMHKTRELFFSLFHLLTEGLLLNCKNTSKSVRNFHYQRIKLSNVILIVYWIGCVNLR